MKKYLLTTTAAGAALAMSAPALAGTNYVTIFGGYSMADESLNNFVTRTGAFSSYSYSTLNYATFSHSHTEGSIFLFSHILYYSTVGYRSTSGVFYSATDFHMSADSGFVIGAAAGYDMGNGVSFEIEFAYRKQDADAKKVFAFSSSYSGYTWQHFASSRVRYYTSPIVTTTPDYGLFATGSGSTAFTIPAGSFVSTTLTSTTISDSTAYTTTALASGDIRAMSIMANAWFDLGGNGSIHPYIGGGLGFADVTLDLSPLSDSSDSGFAYQVGVGIGWDMPDSNCRINLEYRYFAVDGLEFEQGPNTFEYDYDVSEIIIGFKMYY